MTDAVFRHVRFQGRRLQTRLPRDISSAARPRVARAHRAHEVSELSAEELRLFEAVLAHAGLRLADFRPAPMARRRQAVLRALRCENEQQALLQIESDPGQARRALAALVIGHTLGFRDDGVFQNLRETVLPRLGPAPRVWSAGCSRGLELLSVAWLLEAGGLGAGRLLGTDCRPIAPAVDNLLVQDFLSSIPSEFEQSVKRVTRDWVERQIQSIEWRQQDIFLVKPIAEWDLVLCRNVSIYMQPSAAARLWTILSQSLRPGGYLITGKAEHPHPAAGLKRVAHCIFWRDPNSEALAP